MSVDQEKLNQFMQRAVGDLGATFCAALIVIGDKLGLCRAMAEADPATSSELSKRLSVWCSKPDLRLVFKCAYGFFSRNK